MRTLLVFITMMVMALTAGCATDLSGYTGRIPFTMELRERYQLTDAEMSRLQYYTSGKITLRRAVAAGDREIVAGKLVTHNNRLYNEVIVPKGTPAVMSSRHGDGLAMDFGHKALLGFAPIPQDDRHFLYGRERRDMDDVRYFSVNLNDLEYWGVERSDGVYLLIDADALSEVESQRRILTGKTIVPDERDMQGRQYDDSPYDNDRRYIPRRTDSYRNTRKPYKYGPR